jgi:hypothetical protein
MKYVAAALAASRAVGPHEETVGRKHAKEVETEPVAESAKRWRAWRRAQPSDSWKPTHARP